MSDVVIIDSGGANLASLIYALDRLGADAIVSTDPETIAAAPRVILPGVGAARDAMQRLRAKELHSLLPKLKQPVLGVCLGMQLMFDRSAEGDTGCLGIIPGSVQRLQAQPGRPVPHMGWNQLTRSKDDPLLDDVVDGEYVYFVHSYAVPTGSFTLASTQYGPALSAVVRRNNFWGAQFHPERSSAVGARILTNFLRLH